VSVAGRIREAARAGVDRLLDAVDLACAAACDHLRLRVASLEDVEPTVTAELNFTGIAEPALTALSTYLPSRVLVVHGRVEASSVGPSHAGENVASNALSAEKAPVVHCPPRYWIKRDSGRLIEVGAVWTPQPRSSGVLDPIVSSVLR
jgi:hypothetical protein